jgi:two-component system, sensor histidine kinase and response regulator
VLLAEDNPINQRVGAAMLAHLGFWVDIAADGPEAVRAAVSSRYRVILMDCQLPVLDGYEATGQIRRAHGPHRHTPIIAVTGSASAADRQRCLSAGMDDYLAKPFTLKSLAEVLARCAPEEPLGGVLADHSPADSASEAERELAVDTCPPALDAQVVARLERLGETVGEDLVGQLATLFMDDATLRMDGLREAVAADDAGAVLRSAHTLSGSSANIGATDLAGLYATLATNSGDRDGRVHLVESIEVELARVRTALHSLVHTA